MFKIEDCFRDEVKLQHIPEGHVYLFRVRVTNGTHILESGEMAENPQSSTPAYKYARQAQEFAMKIVSEWDFWLASLPYEQPPNNVDRIANIGQSSYPPRETKIPEGESIRPPSFTAVLIWGVFFFAVVLFVRLFLFH